MKKYWCVLAGVLALACMTACGMKEDTEQVKEIGQDTEKQEQSLEIWAWDENFNVKAAYMAVEEFRKNVSEIEIKVVAKEKNEIMQKLRNDLAAQVYEDLPEIVLIEDYEVQKLLADYEDAFLAMDDIIDYSQFQDYKTQLASKNGVHYGVPFDSGAAMMFYREDYIKAAGYTDEDMQNITWDEYIEIGHRVKETAGVAMLTVQPEDLGLIRIMMQSAGSWYVTEDGKSANIVGNEALKEAIRIYGQLISEEIAISVNGWEGFTGAFGQGKVATVVSGCWIAPTIRENEEQSGLWRVAPIPRMSALPDAVNASNIGGSSWYVLDKKENKDLAARFLKETFGGNKEFINELAKEIDLVTTMRDTEGMPDSYAEEEFFGESDIISIFIQTTEKIPVVNYGSNTYEIENILENELQNYMQGESIDKILEKVQSKAQIIID